MSQTGSGNGSFFGNLVYDQLWRRRPHFLHDLSRAVDFALVKETLTQIIHSLMFNFPARMFTNPYPR
ncbi:MAG: hypothetical protein L6277_04890 [Desulfobacterales bacterium]|nr:hypothetical protein [Pseudomonadota bacterium]MBU4355209.1 hypothetical protein [Pseudomonadota bacterium]MCG2771409.1 hypothetical protein [Desulfobacterales bacterium]